VGLPGIVTEASPESRQVPLEPARSPATFDDLAREGGYLGPHAMLEVTEIGLGRDVHLALGVLEGLGDGLRLCLRDPPPP
jgi:hypothetical protein